MALFWLHTVFIFESVGLDHFINGSFNKGTFYKFFGEFTRWKELDNIDTKSSLHLYKTFNLKKK